MASQLEYRRTQLPGSEEIKNYVDDLRAFLENGGLLERKSFIQSFVKEVKVLGDELMFSYSIPMPPKDLTTD